MLATWNKQLATALSKDGGPLTDNVVFSNVQRFPSKRLFLGNSFSHSFRKLQYLRDCFSHLISSVTSIYSCSWLIFRKRILPLEKSILSAPPFLYSSHCRFCSIRLCLSSPLVRTNKRYPLKLPFQVVH